MQYLYYTRKYIFKLQKGDFYGKTASFKSHIIHLV